MRRAAADGSGERRSEDPPEDLPRALDDVKVGARELRGALARTARFAHAAGPSISHVAEFARCPDPTCRRARALLDDEHPGEAAPAPEAPVAPAGSGPSGGEDVDRSWIPLGRPHTPPPRRPGAERPEPAEPPIGPEPPIHPEPPVEPPAPPEPPAAEGPGGGPLVEEPGAPSWGPPAVDLPPDEAMTAEEVAADDASRSRPAARAGSGVAGRGRPATPARGTRREPTIVDAAADAIDHLARVLFGPKRPRR